MEPNEDTVRSEADLLRIRPDDEGDDFDEEENQAKVHSKRQDSLCLAQKKMAEPDDDIGEFDAEPSLITGIPDVEALSTRGLPSCFEHELKLKIFVGLLFAIIVVSLAVIFSFYNHQKYQDSLGNRIEFDEVTRVLKVMNIKREDVLQGTLGLKLPDGMLPYDCGGNSKDKTVLCLRWKAKAQLNVKYHEENKTNCYDIAWTTLDADSLTTPKDCFELDWGYWYGMGLLPEQIYPLNNLSLARSPFTTGTVYRTDSLGPVLDRYLLTSLGVAIYIQPDSPLHLGFNELEPTSNITKNQICLYSDYKDSPFTNPTGQKAHLNYTICVGPTIRNAHDVILQNFQLGPPQRPSDNVFKYPVFSTWAHFKTEYSQSSLLSYIQGLYNHSYSQGLVIIEDGWQSHYGDLDFNPLHFPNPGAMIQQIRDSGFDMCIWVVPFFNTDSENFQEVISQGFAVGDSSGAAPGLTHWWNGPPPGGSWDRGVASVIDLSESAQLWFRQQLQAFQRRYNVSSFYFSGGESDMLPFRPTFTDAYEDPNNFVSTYNAFASGFEQAYPSIVHAAYRSQGQTLLVRLQGTSSTWDKQNGLGSVIPRVLTLGLLGYPFVLPGAIGGSGQPSEELYIRWMQLVTFLPIMHYSRPPFYFANDVEQLSKDLIKLHSTVVVPEVLKVVQEAVDKLYPIIRPPWWNDPDDPMTLTIDTQFLVGNNLLVAPVLKEGARSRDIYLPSGVWQDGISDRSHQGPILLPNYPIGLQQIAYFLKV